MLSNGDTVLYTDFPEDLETLIAKVDESESYEVDSTEIWKTKDGSYVLITASGCSCWDGDFDREDYKTLELLAVGLFSGERMYTPSLHGALELLKQVFENE